MHGRPSIITVDRTPPAIDPIYIRQETRFLLTRLAIDALVRGLPVGILS